MLLDEWPLAFASNISASGYFLAIAVNRWGSATVLTQRLEQPAPLTGIRWATGLRGTQRAGAVMSAATAAVAVLAAVEGR
jgi:hypothetical protein